MSTPIENNTEELQELLRMANSLPEATEAPVFQDKTVSPTTEKQTVTPDADYDALSSVTVNAMPTAEQATPSISVNSSGLITASATQNAGYVSAGTKSSTRQLATQASKTITPSKSSQTAVASGVFTTGAVTVDPIPDNYIQPSGTLNIGTNGLYHVNDYQYAKVDVETGIDTSDATAEADDIVSGATAYVNGEKVTGNLSIAHGGLQAEVTAEAKQGGMPYVQMQYTFSEPKVIKPEYGGQVSLMAPFTDFGDANPEDVVSGKTFTSASGFTVEGAMPVTSTLEATVSDPTLNVGTSDTKLTLLGMVDNTERRCLEVGAVVGVTLPVTNTNAMSKLGDATPADVAAGKTFTSASGFKVTGTASGGGGTQLPTLTNPGSASDLAEGMELIDANGNVVTGTVPVRASLSIPFPDTNPMFGVGSSEDGGCMVIFTDQTSDFLYRPSGMLAGMGGLTIPQSEMYQFGDATASDVAAGKTFTSAEGVTVTGTGAISGEDPFAPDAPFTYQVNPVDGADYGFAINADGYYESQNKGVNYSYAICRISLDVKTACDITFDVINYAESNYDYALFSELNTALGLSYTADSSGVKENFKGRQSATVVNVVYANVPTGNHFIDIKFIKDQSQHSNNDSVQFKVQYDYPLPQTTIDKILEADTDLIAENIKSGVDIFGVVGNYAGFTLPTLTNPANASDIVKDMEVVGADGQKVTGTMPITSAIEATALDSDWGGTIIDDKLALLADVNNAERQCLEAKSAVVAYLPATNTAVMAKLGDATPADVVAGKTFTSASGFKITGTASGGGGASNAEFKALIEGTATNISLPSDLSSIRTSAFYGCTSLALTSLPDGITIINEDAFYGCTSLALTSLPSKLARIRSYSFRGCTGLTRITFTKKPTSIVNSAFTGCTNLTTINVPWAEGAVANAPWGATNATINYNYTGG